MDPSKLPTPGSMPAPAPMSIPASMPIPPVAVSMPSPGIPTVSVGSLPTPPMVATTALNLSPRNPLTATAPSLESPNIGVHDTSKAGKRARPDTTTPPPTTTKRPKSNPLPNPLSSPATPNKGSASADVKPKDVKPTTGQSRPSDSKKASTEEDDCVGSNEIQQFEFDKVSEFGPSMLKRYESYRRSDLRVAKIRKVCAAINPALQKVSEPYTIALKGLAKVFVGEVVETALEVRKQLGDTGPLRPKHLREAYRRLRRDGAVPTNRAREL